MDHAAPVGNNGDYQRGFLTPGRCLVSSLCCFLFNGSSGVELFSKHNLDVAPQYSS